MTWLNEEEKNGDIATSIIEEANELARGSEVLPDGARGLAHRIQEARNQGRPLRVKLGVDPTSTDLHLGHAVVFRKLRRFQEFGHQIVLIIGGFTAQIGDPTGRNSTRPPLTAAQVAENAKTYLEQMGVILDLKKTEIVNNADWLAGLNLSEMLKLASSVTANQLLAKEGFGGRLDKQLPVGFHELFYPLLQAYDSVAIKADIELGGTDQRFNILQGRELQPHYDLPPQMALLLPLLEGTDGVQKMSKSYNNYIGLKEPPSEMFGKCMRIPDELILKYFELATTLPGTEIDQIRDKLEKGMNPRDAKEKLAHQIVHQYHGMDAAVKALEFWIRVKTEGLAPLSEDVEEFPLPSPPTLVFCLSASGMVPSNSEAKRKIKEGAVYVDNKQITDPSYQLEPPPEGSLVKVGRKWKRIKRK